MPLTDTIRYKPIELSLKGKIVDVEGATAPDTLSKIIELQKKGSLINYSGRNIIYNLQIVSFNSTHPNTVHGGLEFDMQLKELRVAKSAYVPKSTSSNNASAWKAQNTTSPEIKVGDTVVFKGGAVYVSSDAKKPAANRERSTCKCTIISKKSYSIHQYHLISLDGKKVYGWVDKANIEGTGNYIIIPQTHAGTQQTQTKTTSTKATSTKATSTKNRTVNNSVTKRFEVSRATNQVKTSTTYHTVKKGESLYSIAQKYGTTQEWLAKNNPNMKFMQVNNQTLVNIGVKKAVFNPIPGQKIIVKKSGA